MKTSTCTTILTFNRPQHLMRVLDALQKQHAENLLVFVDGPRSERERELTSACAEIAHSVAWCSVEVVARQENTGLGGILDSISETFERYERAIFVEDDCLPMPGFTDFMLAGLDRYSSSDSVFSIAGYQPLTARRFRQWPYIAVPSHRFSCWGWASWREQWNQVLPEIREFWRCFDGLKEIPVNKVGSDVASASRACARGLTDTWDVRVAIASLALDKLHMHPVNGVVRNLGVGKGTNPTQNKRVANRARKLHNRNVCSDLPPRGQWPTTEVPTWYLDEFRAFLKRALKPYRGVGQSVRETVLSPLLGAAKAMIKPLLTSSCRDAVSTAIASRNRHAMLRSVELVRTVPPKASKRALLSYLVEPVESWVPGEEKHDHIFFWRVPAMVRSLNRLGYAVDVVDYLADGVRLGQKYDLFVGHGAYNFLQLADQLPQETPVIHFGTGMSGDRNDEADLQRHAGLPDDIRSQLAPDRIAGFSNEPAVLERSSGIIICGNELTAGTYRTSRPVYALGNIVRSEKRSASARRDWRQARRNYLYFAGKSSYHKGLDLLLEAFQGRQETLWVVAQVKEDFQKVFHKGLFSQENINFIGSIVPRSWRYYDIVDRCGFTILPSCAEGGCQSVYEGMNQGLIPVVTPMCGVDTGDSGVPISDCTVGSVETALDECAKLGLEALMARSRLAQGLARTEQSEAAFERKFSDAVKAIIGAAAHG